MQARSHIESVNQPKKKAPQKIRYETCTAAAAAAYEQRSTHMGKKKKLHIRTQERKSMQKKNNHEAVR